MLGLVGFSVCPQLALIKLPVMYVLPSPQSWYGRNAWDGGWAHTDCAPSCCWVLLCCCYHSILDFQVDQLHFACYIIPCDKNWPQIDEMRTRSWSPHLYSLCQHVGHLPLNLSPPAKADPKDEMSSCTKGDLLTMQMESSCTCPVDNTKESTLMSQIWEATEPPPTQSNVQTLWRQYEGAVSYLYITCLWKWGYNIFHCFLSNRLEKSSKLT